MQSQCLAFCHDDVLILGACINTVSIQFILVRCAAGNGHFFPIKGRRLHLGQHILAEMIGNKSRHTATDSSAHIHQCTVVHIIHAGQRRIITVGHGNGHRGLAACCKVGDVNIIQLVLFNARIGRRIGQFAHRQTRAGSRRHADTGAIIREGLGRMGQRNGLGRCVNRVVNGQTDLGCIRTAAIIAVTACRLHLITSILAVAFHRHLITGDGKNGHGQLVGAAFIDAIAGLVVIAHITGVHIGKIQGITGPRRLAAYIGDVDRITLGQIDRFAAERVVAAISMVMAMKVENILSLCTGFIQYIKQILGIFAVTVLIAASAVSQRQVRDNEDGGRRVLARFQPVLHVVGHSLNIRAGTAVTGIIIFVDDIDAITIKILTAGGIKAGSCGVMVALYQNRIVGIEVAVGFLHSAHQGVHAVNDILRIFTVGITIVVTREQKTVHGGIVLLDFF